MKILLTGSSGLIGKNLTVALMRQGHHVFALARSPEKIFELPPENIFKWMDHELPSSEALKNCDAVIHLAGEGIADKLWTQERKNKIRNSRINGTKNIVQAISLLPKEQRPKLLISASAIGIYRHTSEEQDESSAIGNGFLAQLCSDWEKAAYQCEELGVRTVTLRTGLVLGKDGGILSKSGPFILGSGNQWMSWIHVEDVVRFILFALVQSEIKGPFNLTSPHPVQNKDFTSCLAEVKKYPFIIKIPEFILKMIMGELSQAVLANQKIYPSKCLENGFRFKFETLREALNDLKGGLSLLENNFIVKQFVSAERSEVFSFFSKAENLEILTPPWLNFHIVNKSTADIKKDTLIEYKLKIHGFPVKWKTLIKEWMPNQSFVDFQLKGPYKKWHHQHTFEEVPGGTLISDDIVFEIPGGIFGQLTQPFVKKDVRQIFQYRQNKIKELFQKK